MGFCNLLKNVCIETTIEVLFLHDHLCKEKPILAKRDFSCEISILFQNQKAKTPFLWDFFSKQKKKTVSSVIRKIQIIVTFEIHVYQEFL